VKFFDKFIVPWLKEVENIVRPPFGLSLIAIAEKNNIWIKYVQITNYHP